MRLRKKNIICCICWLFIKIPLCSDPENEDLSMNVFRNLSPVLLINQTLKEHICVPPHPDQEISLPFCIFFFTGTSLMKRLNAKRWNHSMSQEIKVFDWVDTFFFRGISFNISLEGCSPVLLGPQEKRLNGGETSRNPSHPPWTETFGFLFYTSGTSRQVTMGKVLEPLIKGLKLNINST